MRPAPVAGQAAHADQVVRCKRQERLPGQFASTDQLGFAQSAQRVVLLSMALYMHLRAT